jgi:hypothetical protein
MLANVPRMDYTNGTPSLLLEPQRTNVLTYSEQFDNAAWVKVATGSAIAPVVTANYGVSPDGYVNADRVVLNTNGTSGSDRSILRQNIASSVDRNGSIYVKSNTGSPQTIGFHTGSQVDIVTATNEWQRFDINFAASVTYFGLENKGDTTAGICDILIWGAQVEVGAYATSYIPTLGAAVTRGEEVSSKVGISNLIGQNEGTFYIDIIPYDLTGQGRYISIKSASGVGNGWTGIFSSGIGTLRFYGDGFDISAGSISIGVRVKAAFSYKNGVLTSAYVNGLIATTLTANTTGKNYSDVEFGKGDFGNTGCCNFNESIFFPTALTNAQLATLTTI